jgi:hypothetical protein
MTLPVTCEFEWMVEVRGDAGADKASPLAITITDSSSQTEITVGVSNHADGTTELQEYNDKTNTFATDVPGPGPLAVGSWAHVTLALAQFGANTTYTFSITGVGATNGTLSQALPSQGSVFIVLGMNAYSVIAFPGWIFDFDNVRCYDPA